MAAAGVAWLAYRTVLKQKRLRDKPNRLEKRQGPSTPIPPEDLRQLSDTILGRIDDRFRIHCTIDSEPGIPMLFVRLHETTETFKHLARQFDKLDLQTGITRELKEKVGDELREMIHHLEKDSPADETQPGPVEKEKLDEN